MLFRFLRIFHDFDGNSFLLLNCHIISSCNKQIMGGSFGFLDYDMGKFPDKDGAQWYRLV